MLSIAFQHKDACRIADVMKLVDMPVLEAGGVTRVGSSPTVRTMQGQWGGNGDMHECPDLRPQMSANRSFMSLAKRHPILQPLRMPRTARIVIPGQPHHVTQRGNRRQTTFFCDDDYRAYLATMAERCRTFGVEVWAYCLMPNHVHLVVVPSTHQALRLAIGGAHERYSRMINHRMGWQGSLWQGRFFSNPLDERHAAAAVRYAEQNPVRAGLVSTVEAYPWSSARAHLSAKDDRLVRVKPMLDQFPDWATFVATPIDTLIAAKLRGQLNRGVILGDASS